MNTGRAVSFLSIMVILPATLLAATAGCSKSISDRDLDLVDPGDALELIEGRKKLLGLAGTETGAWVDPRGARAYREGHIPGAVHLPFQELTAQQQRLRGYDVLIVYGTSVKDDLADGMSKKLLALGFKDVRTLRGGLRAWTRAGFELETGDPRPDSQP